ncbi:hypothetical protein ASF21_10840 [Arthrobacter sp. Leaf234]|uniref:DUF6286 domain-containing protein n=1 Tax=Arthrobacter sp. Leaf234 TaxID=1736303 RepID=UPI0006FB28E2|nr:DUF6286 domain-containing protein [Arthrobacter sp. Leaf234]KQO00807.1 hypothetical protein ASF21_10840 [Arthrobacter sp. Leaf234]
MSTPTTRRSIRKRPSRSVPASIVALVLLAAAVTAVWGGITALTGGNTAVTEGVTGAVSVPWSAQAAYIPSIAVALIGVALIITALIPGRHDAHLVKHEGASEAALTGRGLRTYLEDRAMTIDGVDSARASLKGRQARIRIGTYALDHDEVQKDVHQRLRATVDSLDLKNARRIRVNTSTLNN